MHEVSEAFKSALVECLKPAKQWRVGNFSPPTFLLSNERDQVPIDPEPDDLEREQQYDLIFGEFAWTMRRLRRTLGGRPRSVMNHWLAAISCAQQLTPEGQAAFLMEPSVLWMDNYVFLDLLSANGLHVPAVFQLPTKFYPTTAIRPVVLILTRKPHTKTFVGELSEPAQVQKIVEAYVSGESGKELVDGIYVDLAEFKTFDAYRFAKQIDMLSKQYGEFETKPLGKMTLDINRVRHDTVFDEAENAVYITRHKSKTCTTKLSDLDPAKHHHHFQIILDPEQVHAEYFAAFLQSDLGRLLLDVSMTGMTTQRISTANLRELRIPIPSQDVQLQIAETRQKLFQLQDAITSFSEELALNPSSSTSIVGNITAILDAIGKLSKADHIRTKIRDGESKTLEFKETLSYCLRQKNKQRYIEDMVLKTLAAFMNTDGGTLLVGVNDAGEIVGLNHELEAFHKNSTDKLLLHFKNIFKSRIGESFYPYIEYELVNCDGLPILIAECQSSDRPCYIDGNDFYVRTNPATDKLEGPKLVDYVKTHFK